MKEHYSTNNHSLGKQDVFFLFDLYRLNNVFLMKERRINYIMYNLYVILYYQIQKLFLQIKKFQQKL